MTLKIRREDVNFEAGQAVARWDDSKGNRDELIFMQRRCSSSCGQCGKVSAIDLSNRKSHAGLIATSFVAMLYHWLRIRTTRISRAFVNWGSIRVCCGHGVRNPAGRPQDHQVFPKANSMPRHAVVSQEFQSARAFSNDHDVRRPETVGKGWSPSKTIAAGTT